MTLDETNNIPQPDQIESAIKQSALKKGSFKLDVYDWLSDIPQIHNNKKFVEVRFKSTRKDIYENNTSIPLEIGDIVAVESTSGHDVGIVSLVGELVNQQLKKNRIQIPPEGLKKVYRKAKPTDIEKWNEAKALEYTTMIKARVLSKRLNLNMKIGDVEYQGDRTKAIFYYIADERVDFRELIKVLADEFKVRIEMRQIGARQEAGRIGGIGPCGKALCCSLFIGRFASVGTQAARYQELSLNPQKLAGQCGKLKCCLNFEVDSYMDAQKDFPNTSVPLLFGGGQKAYHTKTDVYKRLMWYICDNDGKGNKFIALTVDKVKEIIALNKQGKELEKLETDVFYEEETDEPDYENVVGQESLTRFDDKNRRNKNKRKPGNRPNVNPNQQNRPNPNPNAQPPKEGGAQPALNPNQGNRPQNPNQRPNNPNQNPNRRPNPNQNPNQSRPQGQGNETKPAGPQNPNQGNRPQNPNQNPNANPRPQNPNQNPNQRKDNNRERFHNRPPRPQNPPQGGAPSTPKE